MRKRLLTSSACLVAVALATGTASAANSITAAQSQTSHRAVGNGSVSSATGQSQSVQIVQDGKGNVARVTQRNISRTIQIGNVTTSSTAQSNSVEIQQTADGDNDVRVSQSNDSRTIQRECRVSGGRDLDIAIQRSVGVYKAVATPNRNLAIVHQRTISITIQRSC
jgi:hypothetical protein